MTDGHEYRVLHGKLVDNCGTLCLGDIDVWDKRYDTLEAAHYELMTMGCDSVGEWACGPFAEGFEPKLAYFHDGDFYAVI